MKLLLDDKTTRGYDLNANEACIFAAILKCTRAGRGWYGNYRELAAAMPFVINRTTVYRAIQKLLNLGLIEERENKTLFAVQIAQESVQNEHESVQNAQECAQNVFPPNNPPINNNMNEKEKEQQRALCARDCEKQQGSVVESFAEFKKQFLSTHRIIPFEFERREASLMKLWNECSEVKRREILAKLAAYNVGVDFDAFKPNPIFFLQDFPEPQPEFLSGLDQDKLREKGIPMVQVKYNGKFLICTRETMELFGLEWERDW